MNGVASGPIWTPLQVAGGASMEKPEKFSSQTSFGRHGTALISLGGLPLFGGLDQCSSRYNGKAVQRGVAFPGAAQEPFRDSGETSQTRLTFEGLCFLKQAFSRL